MRKSFRQLLFISYLFSFLLIPRVAFAHGGEDHEHVSTSMYITIVFTDLVLFTSGFLIIYRLIKGKWIGKWAWVFFLIEDIIFPCQQQEIGSVNLYQFLHGHSIASQEILVLLKNPFDQFYGGIPDILYPAYTAFFLILFGVFIRYLLKNLTILIVASILYIVFRYTMFVFFQWITFPISFVPFPIVVIPIVMYLLRKWPVLGGAIASFLFFMILYGVHHFTRIITPPVSLWMVIPIIIIGVLLTMIRIPEMVLKQRLKHTA